MSAATAERGAFSVVAPPAQRDLYRILFLRKNGSELLVTSERPPFTLPCVEIPKWERVAENINVAVRKRYGISAVCLFTPDLSVTTTGNEQPLYQVMETRKANVAAPEGTYWLPVDSFSDQSFADAQDSRALTNTLRQIHEFENAETIGPFGKPGWIEALSSWAQHEIDPYGLCLSGEFRQLNASPTFALLRLETNGSAVWFKAVGEPNLREFPITLRLARLFPTYIPTILATRPAWNGWLSSEVEGTQLSGTAEIALWETAATALANLQIESIKKRTALLDAGAHDLGLARLGSLVQPFLDVAGQLMDRQAKIPPPTLSRKELASLGEHVEDALNLVGDLRVPDSVGHLDPNPGNIIISPHGCVFLDWAEAYVGHPFFTFGYLVEHFRRAVGKEEQLEQQLIESYAGQWKQVISPAAIAESLTVVPLLAVFAYTTGCGLFSDHGRMQDPETAGYLRGLTRRMSREANQLTSRRQQCST